jgi:phosphoglycolate phosphatase-like HAD superfamily hydrolase
MNPAPIPAPRVCAFDFDGTLVDTMGEFANIAADVLEKNYAIPFAEGRRSYLETSGIPFFQQLELIRPSGEHNAAAAEEFERRKIEGFLDTEPSPDTLRGLAALRAAGIHLAVSSNNFQHLVDAFQARHALPMDLSLGFDAAAGSEKGRPHFERIRREFGVGPGDILFCGDSLKDGERAFEGGLRFAGITGTFPRERFLERFPGIPVVDGILELSQRILADLRPA